MNYGNDNTGHGLIWERPDGTKARCGGPSVCEECALDLVHYMNVGGKPIGMSDDDAHTLYKKIVERYDDLPPARQNHKGKP